MTIQSSLDELISWYDKNKPEAGRTITVKGTADTVSKFAKLGPDGKYRYRDRIIVPLKKSRQQLREEAAAELKATYAAERTSS